MEIVNIEARTFEAMMERFEKFAQRVDVMCRDNGDKALNKWLDNQEVCEILNITKRTLQTYRDRGMIGYTQINSKIYYRPEDVEALIHSLKNG